MKTKKIIFLSLIIVLLSSLDFIYSFYKSSSIISRGFTISNIQIPSGYALCGETDPYTLNKLHKMHSDIELNNMSMDQLKSYLPICSYNEMLSYRVSKMIPYLILRAVIVMTLSYLVLTFFAKIIKLEEHYVSINKHIYFYSFYILFALFIIFILIPMGSILLSMYLMGF